MIDQFLTIVPPWVIVMVIILNVALGAAAYFILLERKVAAWVQDRIGPNRVGPRGLLQPIADGLKMFTKEDYRSPVTDKWLFSAAPIIMILVVFVAVAVIPWGGIYQGTLTGDIHNSSFKLPSGGVMVGEPVPASDGLWTVTYRAAFQIADVNIGLLYIVAITALAVYAVVLAGWASNNKFSFLGGMRAAAQMISYEIPLGLSIVTVVIMFGTLSLSEITSAQAHYWFGFIPAWNIFCQPLAFLMFLICLHAEANRAPFDLAEAEQELVGGYHTEYSSMRLGLLLMGEYIEIFITSGFLVALFLGGWHFPGLTGNVDPANPAVTTSFVQILLRIFVYIAKIVVVVGVFMWVRWSLPRIRYDQLMNLAWRAMVPIALSIMISTALVVFFYRSGSDAMVRVSGNEALLYLLVNVVLVVVFFTATSLMSSPQVNKRVLIPGSRFGNDKPAAANEI